MTVTDSLASFPDFFQIAKENEVVVWWGRGQVGTAALPVVAFRGSARERGIAVRTYPGKAILVFGQAATRKS